MPAALNEWPTGPSAAADFYNKICHERSFHNRVLRLRIMQPSGAPRWFHLKFVAISCGAVVSGEASSEVNILGSTHPDILLTPLMIDPFVLVCRRDHQLAQQAAVSWADVTEHRLIGVSRESGNRFVLDNALAQNSIQISLGLRGQSRLNGDGFDG